MFYKTEAEEPGKRTYPDILVISQEIYLALHPIEQMMAQALQKLGKEKIMYKDPKFNNKYIEFFFLI